MVTLDLREGGHGIFKDRRKLKKKTQFRIADMTAAIEPTASRKRRITDKERLVITKVGHSFTLLYKNHY
jgi:hypothetical protein